MVSTQKGDEVSKTVTWGARQTSKVTGYTLVLINDEGNKSKMLNMLIKIPVNS